MTQLMSWLCVHPVRMEKDMERVGVNTARHLPCLQAVSHSGDWRYEAHLTHGLYFGRACNPCLLQFHLLDRAFWVLFSFDHFPERGMKP